MFGKSNDTETRSPSSSDRHGGQSILQEGVVVRGEIEAKGDVRLDGTLDGKIEVSSRLTIGTNGLVKAEVHATDVVVMGRVEGSIVAKGRIDLKKGAHVTGNLQAPTLTIEEGVFFEGQAKMGAAAEMSKPKKPEGEILSIEKKPTPAAR